MTDQQAIDEIKRIQDGLSEEQLDWIIPTLEGQLKLRAAVLGWTGEPLKQPATSVLASLQAVLTQNEVNA